jgi:hypothetical protein
VFKNHHSKLLAVKIADLIKDKNWNVLQLRIPVLLLAMFSNNNTLGVFSPK